MSASGLDTTVEVDGKDRKRKNHRSTKDEMLRAIRHQNKSVEIIKTPMRASTDNFASSIKTNNYSIKVGGFDEYAGLSTNSKVVSKNVVVEND